VVQVFPILMRFRQDEARAAETGQEPTAPVADVAATQTGAPVGPDGNPLDEHHQFEDWLAEEAEQIDPEPVPVIAAVPPQGIAEGIARAAQERRQREAGAVETNGTFGTPGARHFAEALARATQRGR
jgi:hypothetical protein